MAKQFYCTACLKWRRSPTCGRCGGAAMTREQLEDYELLEEELEERRRRRISRTCVLLSAFFVGIPVFVLQWTVVAWLSDPDAPFSYRHLLDNLATSSLEGLLVAFVGLAGAAAYGASILMERVWLRLLAKRKTE